MKTLLKGNILKIKQNFSKYLSLFIFITLTICVVSSMISTAINFTDNIHKLSKKSGLYDYYIDDFQNSNLKINNKVKNIKDNEDIKNFYKMIGKKFFKSPNIPDPITELSKDLRKISLIFNNKKWNFVSSDESINNINEDEIKNFIKSFPDNPYYLIQPKDKYQIKLQKNGLDLWVLNQILTNENSPLLKKYPKLKFFSNVSIIHRSFYSSILNLGNKNKKIFFQLQLASNSIPNTLKDIINKNNFSFFTRNSSKIILANNNLPLPVLNKNEIAINKTFASYSNLKINNNLNFFQKSNSNLFSKSNLFSQNKPNISKTIKYFAKSTDFIFPLIFNPSEASSGNIYSNSILKDGTIIYCNYDDFYSFIYDKTIKDNSLVTINLGKENNFRKNNIIHEIFSKYFSNSDGLYDSFSNSPSGIIFKNSDLILIVELVIAFIILLVICIILYFFIKKNVLNQKSKIGILKSLGYKNLNISFIFSLEISFIIIISVFIGYFISIFLNIYFVNVWKFNVGIYLSIFTWNYYIFLFILIFLPLFFFLISIILTFNCMNKNLLYLIYDSIKKDINYKKNYKLKRKRNSIIKTSFSFRLAVSFAFRSISRWLIVGFIFTFDIYLMIFQFDGIIFNNNYINSGFSYLKKNVDSINFVEKDQLDMYYNSITTDHLITKDPWIKIKPYSYKWLDIDNKDNINFDSSRFNKEVEIRPGNIEITINNEKNELWWLFLILFFGYKSDDYDKFVEEKNLGPIFDYFKLIKDSYIKSSDVERLYNAKINIDGTKFPLIDIIKEFARRFSDQVPEEIKSILVLLENFKENSNNNFPKIYLGNKLWYDTSKELPIIIKKMFWPSDFYDKNKVFSSLKNLSVWGVPFYKYKKFSNFLDFGISNVELNNFININNFDKSKFYGSKRNPIPAIFPEQIIVAGDFKIGDIIPLKIILFPNITSENLSTVYYKVSAITKNSNVSNNIYVPNMLLENHLYNKLSNILNSNYSLYSPYSPQIIKKDINNYYNALLVKSLKSNQNLVSQFYNIWFIANEEKYYHRLSEFSKPHLQSNLLYTSLKQNNSYYNFSKKVWSNLMELIRKKISKTSSFNFNNYIFNNMKFHSNFISDSDKKNYYPFIQPAKDWYPKFSSVISNKYFSFINLLKLYSFNGIKDINKILYVTIFITNIIVIFILFSLFGLIFDDNKKIILTFKSLGYRSPFICSTILGFYLFIMMIGFIFSFFLSYFTWLLINNFVFFQSGIFISSYISPLVLFLSIIITLVLITFNFLLGFIVVNREPVRNITVLRY